MIVLFDFYEIAIGKGKSIGIYNYALSILNTLAQNNTNIHLIVACNGIQKEIIKNISGIEIIKISENYPSSFQRFYWRYYKSIRLAKKNKADIYYSPKGFSPGFIKRKIKPYIVLTIHDLIPFYYLEHFPKYFSKFENQFITKSLKSSIINANSIITISNFSKQMIFEKIKSISNSNIHLIYNGVTMNPNNKVKQESTPYIFAITSNLPHKNKNNIIKGYLHYRSITENALPIKICGITIDEQDIIKTNCNYIEFIGYADQKIFENIFLNASLLLFLPLIEGFGFPPLEASSYGVPAVVSNIPVLREILDKSAYFVDPQNPKEIGEGIYNVLSDSKIAENLLEHGKQAISKYTWVKCCNKIENVFDETIKNCNAID